MKAIILAAGRGKRLGSATDNAPKCMFEYLGRPLIEHIKTNLENFFDPSDIFVVSGYRAEQLQYLDINSIVNPDWSSTNIMGSLLCADSLLTEDETLITYSDIYYAPDAISKLLNLGSPAVVNIANWSEIWHKRFSNPLVDLERFSADQNGFLTSIGGRAAKIEEIEGQFGGIYSLNPSAWNWLKTNIADFAWKDTTTTLNELAIKSSFKVGIANYLGPWAEIDTLEDVIAQT
jgi:choline kinase